jgi:mRNA interferase MazF
VTNRRGEIWWASLRDPAGSEPGFRNPVLVVQSNPFNHSKTKTVITAVITSNLRLAGAPGNVSLTRRQSGLRTDSVINVSQLVTLDKVFLFERIGRIPPSKQHVVDDGLRLALAL